MEREGLPTIYAKKICYGPSDEQPMPREDRGEIYIEQGPWRQISHIEQGRG